MYLQCRHFPMTLSYTDIEALQPGEWVTDDVIDFYFRGNKKYAFIPVPIANLLTERPIDTEKDQHDPEEQEWKIKDKDAILPDSMREYLIKIIYSATITQSASASL
ncbi:hypothetical protein H4S08_002340 [Coemansia sp. RSA 1365]|nr:hypothetical protein H4S08_002340 [Coemansia sp. RSA 1365]